MTTIYKKDTKENIRFLNVYTKGDLLIQESGIIGTDNPITHSRICTPKNVGKSNETSGSEQALYEGIAIIKAKLTAGYFVTEDEAKSEDVTLPMLADSYDKHVKKIDWSTCFIQPKLDGMRCLAIIKDGKVSLKSRDGKVIANMMHIESELTNLDDCILDGELYKHGDSFQENMKLIKKYRKGKTEEVKFHVYDMISDNEFAARILNSDNLISNFKHSVSVQTNPMPSEKYLKGYHSANLADGYEGSIIRYGTGGYEKCKRSNSLLKYKDFSDMDCVIVDIIPSDKRPLHGKPIFELNGQRFSSGVKMSHDDREELLTNKHLYKGKRANLRFFEMSDTGIPRFPVMIGIHEDR